MPGDETTERGEYRDGGASGWESSLEQAVRNGRLRAEESAPTIELTIDFLAGLYDSFVSPESAMYQVGVAWGRALGARLEQGASALGGDLSTLRVEDLLLLIQDELTRARWGRVSFDVERYASKGIILATLMAGPAAVLPESVAVGFVALTAGFLGGVVGRVTGLPMEGTGKRFERGGVVLSEIVVGHEARISRVRTHLSEGLGWHEALAAG